MCTVREYSRLAALALFGGTTTPCSHGSARPSDHTTHAVAWAPLGRGPNWGAGGGLPQNAMSNDANEANFVENAGHIARLKSQMKRHSPGDDDHSELANDAFDYYERSLQLRVMQNNTQKMQIDDMAAGLQAAQRKVSWLRTQRALFFLAALAVAACQFVPPDVWAEEWKLPVAAHAAGLAVVLAMLACWPIGSGNTDPAFAAKMQ